MTAPRLFRRRPGFLLYYASSVPTLLRHLRPRSRVASLFLGLPLRRPFPVRTPEGATFQASTRMDIWIVKETCLDRFYERGGVSPEAGWNVLDIGAGFGDFAVSIARRQPSAAVYAFEPSPDSFARLLDNVSVNRLTNVRCFAEAIAGRAGPLRLSAPEGLPSRGRVSGEADDGGIPVPSITLGEAVARLPGADCDFLKIDCEGSEYDILFSSSEETLARIRHIALEYHDAMTSHSHGELVRFLEARGFRVQARRNPVYRDVGFLYASRASPGRLPERRSR